MPHPILLALLLLAPMHALLAEDDILLDAGLSRSGWTFHDGGEFPGATGALRADNDGLALSYDFSAGGSYVSATFNGAVPPLTHAAHLTCHAEQDCAITWRWEDVHGRTFQGFERRLAAGDRVRLTITHDGPWTSAWGGTDGAAPGHLARISLVVTADQNAPVVGNVRLLALHAESQADAALIAPSLELPAIDTVLAGWHVQGTWTQQWRRPVLRGTATPLPGAAAGELTLRLPRLGRDQIQRIALRADTAAFTFTPDLVDGGHPAARYALTLAVTAGQIHAQREYHMIGRACVPWTMGAFRHAQDIPRTSIFGVCAHFAYGRSGAFSGWRDYESLIDEAASAGFTWIRDGAKILRNDDGTFTVDPYDLAWIRYAHAQGIRTILIIGMNAADGQDTAAFAARCAAVAEQTRDVIDVFELGNEPNNFGDWRKVFGGPWNGKEADNGTSAWVAAHLAATNAGAEAIKATRPDVTVIGLGSPPPTNVRALRLGLSPAVDGVVDHPYSFALPPELVPYGAKFAERDGVNVGDDRGTFRGLITSLHEAYRDTGHDRSTWLTEFGWTTFRYDGNNEKGLYAAYSEDAQAAYLVRRHLLGLAAGVAVSCQYALLDDYGSRPDLNEANFGIIRGDRSRKPAFAAVARLNALVGGGAMTEAVTVTVEAAPLHRAAQTGVLIRDWDQVALRGDDSVQALAIRPADGPARLSLALWSAQPWHREQAPRAVRLRVSGVATTTRNPVAIATTSGDVMDVPMTREGDDVILRLVLDAEPVIVQFFE